MSGALFVAWRGGDASAGEWAPVGRLDRNDEQYRFVYTRGARTLRGFAPFPGMPELSSIYESDELFPLFANRLLAKSRPEYDAFLAWGGFHPDNPPDPIAILGVTEGMRQTDSVEVFPCPSPDVNGRYVGKFFLHGVRFFPQEAQTRIDRLQPGETLGLMFDVSNRNDADAIAVRTCDARDRYIIGYAPRYLARDIHELVGGCGAAGVELRVERVNRDAPLQQRLLCRLTACWPEQFDPCNRDEFQPIVENLSIMGL